MIHRESSWLLTSGYEVKVSRNVFRPPTLQGRSPQCDNFAELHTAASASDADGFCGSQQLVDVFEGGAVDSAF